jgi:DNA-binding NarL/FixJ family response regulator
LSSTILLVDDCESWRHLICSMVKNDPGLKMILLDIGLPHINGIEAARRIRQVSPSSKIVFLTMNNSPDVTEAALSTGAQGFVHKIRVQGELLPVIELVLRRQPVPSTSKPTRSLSPLICLNEPRVI